MMVPVIPWWDEAGQQLHMEFSLGIVSDQTKQSMLVIVSGP